VELLQPNIRVKAKDKLGSADSVPNDFNQLKQKVAQIVSTNENDKLSEAF
jgi:hypothetical protein